MRQTRSYRWNLVVLAIIGVAICAVPDSAHATIGQARAVQAAIVGAPTPPTTTLADTGPLGGAMGAFFPQHDTREASLLQGIIPSLLTGDLLHATTIGWEDQVASEASIRHLVLSIAGTTITADFVMARAKAAAGTAATGNSDVVGLFVNGLPIMATGQPNQRIDFQGGYLLINELQSSPGSVAVNALHIVITGVADVVIASAIASQ